MRVSSVSRRRLSRAVLLVFLLCLALPALAQADAVYHVLAKGETLYSVARSYGITVDAIVKANSIADPSRLKLGMKLLIPGEKATAANSGANAASAADTGEAGTSLSYKVAKGDTLFSIARSYGVSVDALRKANKLATGSVLKYGEKLELPAGAKAPDPAPAAQAAPAASAPVTSAPAAKSSPTEPEAVKTSVKAVNKSLSWPCAGEILYLDGKVYGIVIKAKEGAIERAVAAGTVSSAGPYRGYGNVVFVLSRTGHIYVYGGNDSLSVRAGDKVVAGQALGKVGMDAKQGSPAAYFLVFKNGEAIDPAEAPRD
jgi:murein DD-endopeptidase MepM/ murein hydrolase activator NlpD